MTNYSLINLLAVFPKKSIINIWQVPKYEYIGRSQFFGFEAEILFLIPKKKLLVFWYFQRDQKGILGKKGLIPFSA